ncbi:MAG: GNAT family N-acetyltransferase [Actinobacteria bacterium]|nr:MAG: GNAT family N-acetyltransferase [Actinomycetota bacterium]
MTVVVRPATRRDLEAVTTIHIASFVKTYANYPKTVAASQGALESRIIYWQSRLEDSELRVIVAESDGKVAGFALIGPIGDEESDQELGHVYSIHVSPDRYGLGIGRELMVSAERQLVEMGFEEATLWVVVDNTGARRFYERIGWYPDGQTKREVLGVSGEDGDDARVVGYRKRLARDGGEE